MTWQEQFINKYSQVIIEATEGTNLFPSVKMAQLCLETYYGKTIASGNTNLFGIKATGNTTPYWNGFKVLKNTQEDDGGVHFDNDYFRAYKSASDSIKDHTYLLTQRPRFAIVINAKGPGEQAQALQDAGYATDPNYAVKLVQIMNKYDLYKLDKKKV